METPRHLFQPRSCLSVLLAACVLTAPAAAQTEAGKKRHARFLAVGEIPPFRQEIRDGVRYELDPPPGSIPPREVTPRIMGKSLEPASLRLGRISPKIVVPKGTGPLVLSFPGEKPDAAPWVAINTPEEGDFLVMLWRDPQAGSWNKARAMVVAEAPPGHALVVNTSPVAVRMLWDEEAMVLSSGKSVLRALPDAKETVLSIMTADTAGSMKRYFSGSVAANSTERCLVSIYRADGEKPRRPLKVSILREPASLPR